MRPVLPIPLLRDALVFPPASICLCRRLNDREIAMTLQFSVPHLRRTIRLICLSRDSEQPRLVDYDNVYFPVCRIERHLIQEDQPKMYCRVQQQRIGSVFSFIAHIAPKCVFPIALGKPAASPHGYRPIPVCVNIQLCFSFPLFITHD